MANIFDIHIQILTAAEQANTFKLVGFGTTPTLGVKGFQLLINMWLKCMLTPRGSDATDLSYGTPFANLIGSNVSLADARDTVLLSIEQCNSFIFNAQKNDATLTPSEKLSTAKLINYIESTSDPGFQAYVEIQNQARERLTLNLPVLVG